MISFAVTAKLICVFVFAYAKSRFSHNEAHILFVSRLLVILVISLFWFRGQDFGSDCDSSYFSLGELALIAKGLRVFKRTVRTDQTVWIFRLI